MKTVGVVAGLLCFVMLSSVANATAWSSVMVEGNKCLNETRYLCAYEKYKSAWKMAHNDDPQNIERIFASMHNLALSEIILKEYSSATLLITAIEKDVLPALASIVDYNKYINMRHMTEELSRALHASQNGEEIYFEGDSGKQNRVPPNKTPPTEKKDTAPPEKKPGNIKINIYLYCADPQGCDGSNLQLPAQADWGPKPPLTTDMYDPPPYYPPDPAFTDPAPYIPRDVAPPPTYQSPGAFPQ